MQNLDIFLLSQEANHFSLRFLGQSRGKSSTAQSPLLNGLEEKESIA